MTGAAARFFDAVAGRYDRVYALPAAESRRRMVRVLRALPPAPSRVLDLGVGTGRELGALLDAGLLPTGVDASKPMIERCARRARPVPLVEADFWQPPLPFESGAFDAAIALHGTLAHPPDGGALERLGNELARVVGKGGIVVAEVPSPAWLDAIVSAPRSEDRHVRRTGPRTCLCEDVVVGFSIEARVFDDAEWRVALGPAWQTNVESLGELEWFVVAQRV
jgi:SAM-dependent methyltransferase